MLKSDDIAAVVSQYPMLSDLPPALKNEFIQTSLPLHSEKNVDLFNFSSIVQSYGLLSKGTIRVTWQRKAREIVLYRLHPGEFCIITACNILSETRYQAVATTETRVSGVAIPALLFTHMIEQAPLFSRCIYQTISSRLAGLLDLINAIGFMRLDERLAGLLLSRGTVIQATHVQLADELGSVREVVSRILKEFEIKGLVKLERNQIQLLDPAALEKIARRV